MTTEQTSNAVPPLPEREQRTQSQQRQELRRKGPHRNRQRPRWARGLEALLLLFGVLALGWVGWGYLDAHLYQQRQERLLEEALAAPPPAEAEPIGIPADELAGSPRDVARLGEANVPPSLAAAAPASASADAPRMPPSSPRARAASARTLPASSSRSSLDALGRLSVARLGLSVMVAEGVDNHTLRRAAGHIPGTARIGSGGNAGIAGHRDGFFRPLKDVRPGDEIVITTPGAITRYRVEWAEVVPPDETSSLRPTRYPALTLVTCYPFHYVGNAPDRFVVRARLVESRASTAADADPVARRGR